MPRPKTTTLAASFGTHEPLAKSCGQEIAQPAPANRADEPLGADDLVECGGPAASRARPDASRDADDPSLDFIVEVLTAAARDVEEVERPVRQGPAAAARSNAGDAARSNAGVG
mmetsp:Transcript_33150/g.102731  ORF Transcript_33150/g.102731 Transcript_33150/m.102731 type:complete len:114 (-) Transcript_33150:5-346(-)